MADQITVRADDELLDRVRAAARRAGRSMNEYVVRVLDAATDPALAGTEATQLRERLLRAGLLAEPARPARARPAAAHVDAARRRAAGGTALSSLVSSDR